MKNVYFYLLYDPSFISQSFYFGYTNNPKQRLTDHLKPYRLEDKTIKNNWIKSLLKRDIRPTMAIIGNTTDDLNYKLLEREWISLFKFFKISLVNGTDGGEGLKNPSTETRKKISIANKGKKRSAETRQKISLSNRGVSKPPRSIEYRNNIAHARIGKKHSPETIAKLCESQQKRWNKHNEH